jgi:hypothetical protein
MSAATKEVLDAAVTLDPEADEVFPRLEQRFGSK